MKGLDREQDAYDEGRRAAIRGEALNQYQPSYRRRPELWTRFLFGYNDGLKLLADIKHDIAFARQKTKHANKCEHAGGGSK